MYLAPQKPKMLQTPPLPPRRDLFCLAYSNKGLIAYPEASNAMSIKDIMFTSLLFSFGRKVASAENERNECILLQIFDSILYRQNNPFASIAFCPSTFNKKNRLMVDILGCFPATVVFFRESTKDQIISHNLGVVTGILRPTSLP